MDKYITGSIIKQLRESKGLTQAALAEKLYVSAKTVSKWETGKGYPDISMLEPLAAVFHISVTELLTGAPIRNRNIAGNLLRSKFYVCPICGNIMYSVGEAQITCHGILLPPQEAEPEDGQHSLSIEVVEDEYYIRVTHEMSKQHYISFLAALSDDRLQFVKLYPEGEAEARFKINAVKAIYFLCNRDGLYFKKIVQKRSQQQ